MFVHSTKTFLFKKDGEQFHLRNLSITPVPEWIAETDTFKMAKKEGSLTVIDNKEKQIAAENGDLDQPVITKTSDEDENTDSTEEASSGKSKNKKDSVK